MTTLPKVSVIIATRNRPRYICEAVDSVLAQTYQSVEIIIVDGSSTDETHTLLNSYEDKVRYFYQEAQGLSAALNFGIEKSSGQYLAFLHDDDILLPEMLEVQVAHLEAHPKVGMVHAEHLIMDETSDDPGPRKQRVSGAIPSGYILPRLIIKNVISHPTVVVRRPCLDKVGFYDLENRLSLDYDLWLRIAQYFLIDYIDRPLVIYRMHTTNLSLNRINQMQDHLAALEKMLRLNPEVIDVVGRDVVDFALAFKTAYMLFDQGSYMEARRYFSKARRIRPFHWPCYGYYLACWLPPSWVIGLRIMNQSLERARMQTFDREQLRDLSSLGGGQEN